MRKVWGVILVLLFLSQPCFPLSYGIFHRSRTTDPGNIYGGGYVILVGTGDGVGVMGQVRTGLTEELEAGVRAAYISTDGSEIFTIGGDGQYMFFRSMKELPINFSGIGGLDLSFGDGYNAFAISGGAMCDGRLELKRTVNIYPYGVLLLMYTHSSFGRRDDNNVDVAVTGGVIYKISDMTEIVGEIRIYDDVNIGVGLNFR